MRITLASGEVLGESNHPAQALRMSQSLFCPGCGEVWARVSRGPTWYAMAKWCGRSPSCESLYAVPGSFFGVLEGGTDADTFLEFPAFLAREFEVQLSWAERHPIAGQPASQGELV